MVPRLLTRSLTHSLTHSFIHSLTRLQASLLLQRRMVAESVRISFRSTLQEVCEDGLRTSEHEIDVVLIIPQTFALLCDRNVLRIPLTRGFKSRFFPMSLQRFDASLRSVCSCQKLVSPTSFVISVPNLLPHQHIAADTFLTSFLLFRVGGLERMASVVDVHDDPGEEHFFPLCPSVTAFSRSGPSFIPLTCIVSAVTAQTSHTSRFSLPFPFFLNFT